MIYRDVATGNAGLSIALEDLAKSLSSKRTSPQKDMFAGEDDELTLALRDLDAEKINNVLENDNITKSELIKLAMERFSIPRSKLLKLTRDGVCMEIKSALLHEESLKILSQEAKRGGNNRVS